MDRVQRTEASTVCHSSLDAVLSPDVATCVRGSARCLTGYATVVSFVTRLDVPGFPGPICECREQSPPPPLHSPCEMHEDAKGHRRQSVPIMLSSDGKVKHV